MKQQYEQVNLQGKTRLVVERINSVIDEYARAGHSMTLRQLYYQGIARDLFPEAWRDAKTGTKNTQKNYKKLVNICTKARMGGLMDWNAIVDRTRGVVGNSHWSSPADIIDSCAYSFRYDTRQDQDYYVEVWIEKDALTGTIDKACRDLDVPYFSCRGYASLTSMHNAARNRFAYNEDHFGQKPVIIHLGDHDPSGIDMTRDIYDRHVTFRSPVKVDRIALTMTQVRELDPPPMPAKQGDSRTAEYIAETGGEDVWELDALSPTYIERIVREAVGKYTDDGRREAWLERQDAARKTLLAVSENWDRVEQEYGD